MAENECTNKDVRENLISINVTRQNTRRPMSPCRMSNVTSIIKESVSTHCICTFTFIVYVSYTYYMFRLIAANSRDVGRNEPNECMTRTQ